MQNPVLAQVGTNPSDTVAAEGGSNFFSFGEPISSSHQKHSETVTPQNLLWKGFSGCFVNSGMPVSSLNPGWFVLTTAKNQLHQIHFTIKPVK